MYKVNNMDNAPKMLRLVADKIEKDDYGNHNQIQIGLIIKDVDTGNIDVFGYGKNYNDFETLIENAREKLIKILNIK